MRLLLLLLPFMMIACTRVRPEPTTWHSHDAYRLSNGTVELVAVPSIGRIVHYAYVNGPNVFWTWPDGGKEPKKYTGFKNFGGEKVWLWPQTEWPPAADSIPYTATIDGDTLTLVSAEVPKSGGVKIRRHIRMDPTGTGVTITNELILPPNHTPRIALWSVAQVPPATIKARLLDPAKPAVHAMDPAQPLWQPASREGDIAVFERNGQSIKSGLESDLITSTADKQTFAIQALTSPGPFDPGTRAQLYADQDQSFTRPRDTTLPYIEIEFLSPWLTRTPAPTLTTRWSLERAP